MRSSELALGLGPPVGDVTGVDDRVHVELVDEELDEVERLRVEVDVADVQHADGAVVGVERRQALGGLVERDDVADELGQLDAVPVEVLDDRTTSPTAVGAIVNRPV